MAASETSTTKKRISRACDACHTRKVKCDGGQPSCSECVRNELSCTFDTMPKKRGRKSCRVDSIRDLEQQKRMRLAVETTGTSLSPHLGPNSAEDQFVQFHSGYGGYAVPGYFSPELGQIRLQMPVSPPIGYAGEPGSVRSPQNSVLGIHSPSLGGSIHSPGLGIAFQQSPTREDLPGNAYFNLGSSSSRSHSHSLPSPHPVSSAEKFSSPRLSSIPQVTSSLGILPPVDQSSPSSGSELGMDGPIKRSGSTTSNSTHNQGLSSDFPAPSLEIIQFFGIEMFFASVYPIFPLVHGPSIRSAFNSGLMERDSRFSALIYSMCAISASQTSLGSISSGIGDIPGLRGIENFSNPVEAGEVFFKLSLNHRGLLTAAEDTMDVQTTYFLGQYAHNVGKESVSWHYLGEAIRLGLGLNLHVQREEEYIDLVDREIRRRLLWQLFTCDKSDALIADRPMVVRSDEISVPFPLEVDDEFINPTFISSQPSNRLSIITGFNAVNRLFKTFEELVLGFRADRRQLLSMDISDAKASLPLNDLRQSLYKGLSKVSSALEGLPPPLQMEEKIDHPEGLDPRLQIQRANLHVTKECMSLVFYTHYSSLLGSAEDPYLRNSTIIFKGQTASRLLRVLKSVSRDDLKQNGAHLVLKVRIVAKTLLDVVQLAPDPSMVAQASRDLADYLEILASISSLPAENPSQSSSGSVPTPLASSSLSRSKDGKAKLDGSICSPSLGGTIALPPSPPNSNSPTSNNNQVDPNNILIHGSLPPNPPPGNPELDFLYADAWGSGMNPNGAAFNNLNGPPFWESMMGEINF